MAHPMGSEQENVISEARALLGQNQPAEAARILRLHLQRNPGTATDYMLLGVVLSQSGQGLLALQALEQAVAMEPGNATAHYNLGQAYREFGRHREALAELERALQLRPDYPAATRAIGEVRRHLVAPSGANIQPPAGAASPAPLGPPLLPPEGELVDDRPLLQRLLSAAWQLIGSPGQAFNGGLDHFFNTPGAVGAVVTFFLVSVGLSTVAAWFSTPHGEGSGGALLMLSSVVSVIATAGTIAMFNQLTGGVGDFGSDFGSLALSFALIEATLSLVSTPLILLAAPAGAAGFVVGLAFVVGLWKYGLELGLVMATTEINLFTAIVLLAVARIVSAIATGMVIGALLGALLGTSLR